MSELENSAVHLSSVTFNTLISEEQIQSRIKELAVQIKNDFGEEEVILVGILKGCSLFIADLCRELGTNVVLDFMQVSSYEGGLKSTGNVQVRKDLDSDIFGKNVLLVEDIVDTGLTLYYLRKLLETRRPKALKVVSLLSKPECRLHNIEVEYIGFDIPNEFVVGYGLDYAEKLRNLPCIVTLQFPQA